MLLNSGDRIVFTGDSITDCERLRPIGEGFFQGVGNGFVRQVDNLLNVMYPDRYFWITNTAIGGETSRGMLARWQTDVLDLKPDWVNLMIGMNDVWRNFDQPAIRSYHVPKTEYKDNLARMLEQTMPVVKGVFLMSPFYLEPNQQDPMRSMANEYVEVCRETAKEYGCRFADMQAAFDDYLQYRHPTYVSGDRVHPGPIGSTLIAREFLKLIEADRAFV